jgi:3-hydroxyacyl-CoA dehydrogenase
MSNGIAYVFTQDGFRVTLIDISLSQFEKAIQIIGKSLDRQTFKVDTTAGVEDATD